MNINNLNYKKMKKNVKLFKETGRILTLVLLILFTTNCNETTTAQIAGAAPPPDGQKKIKIALLLDTSNSMDGLIDQAKSQLWNIVNELATAKCDNTKPKLEIALYEYGNDGLSSAEGYIRQVSAFTDDLDLISEKLFSLRTNGGNEFCGYVINSSLSQLEWNNDGKDLQIIFIAGNEPFTQGSISYRESCSKAKKKHVVVNTIFCGNFNQGVNTNWKDGADLTNGSYMSIEQNSKTVYISSPYDKKITALNQQLNDTYVAYGSLGKAKKSNQVAQDNNAGTYGAVNEVQRTVSKSSHVYNNKSWDIIDASEEADFEIDELKKEDLPKEMQNMTKEEKEKYITDNKVERQKVQKEINELNRKRIEYVAEKRKETDTETSLDDAMIKAIKEQAKTKNFEF
jgi:hypothetical protein